MHGRSLIIRLAPWLAVLAGGGGLVALVLTVYPSPGAGFLFLGLFFVAGLGGFYLLLRALYTRRLSPGAWRSDPQRPAREAFLLASFLTACAWLRMLRLLTLTNGLLLLGVLMLAEAFWLSRVR